MTLGSVASVGELVRPIGPHYGRGHDETVARVGGGYYTFQDGAVGRQQDYLEVSSGTFQGTTYFADPDPQPVGLTRAQSIDAWLAEWASEKASPADPIARPAHYARYAIEPITFIMANDLPFCVGNVVKYVLRYDAKNGREDLLKARRYIDMILEDMDRKAKGTVGDVVGNPL